MDEMRTFVAGDPTYSEQFGSQSTPSTAPGEEFVEFVLGYIMKHGDTPDHQKASQLRAEYREQFAYRTAVVPGDQAGRVIVSAGGPAPMFPRPQ